MMTVKGFIKSIFGSMTTHELDSESYTVVDAIAFVQIILVVVGLILITIHGPEVANWLASID